MISAGNKFDHRYLTSGTVICCLLFIGYYWYFQQLVNTLEPLTMQDSQQTQQMASKPLVMTKVSLPSPPPLPSVTKIEKVAKQKPSAVKPAAKQAKRQKTKPEPTKPQQTIVDVSKNSAELADGGQLLQQVEAGQGPGIEIAWPKSFAQRKRLFTTLTQCLGVQLGILVDDSVYPIKQKLNAYSRLVRVVSGVMLPAESRLYQRSRRTGTPVRLFPRALDARLLAGLRQLSPMPFQAIQSVRGLYVLKGQRLFIEDLQMDGRAVSGQVLLADGCG